MRLHNPQGDFVTAEFEPQDVEAFAGQWPCFDGPDRVTFTFQRSNGDLVDMDPCEWDGGAALAMSQDAWAHFVERAGDIPAWDRFDICEAWALLAHDFGLYGLAERLRGMCFRARPGLCWETLSPNAQEIYARGEARARQTGRWARGIGRQS